MASRILERRIVALSLLPSVMVSETQNSQSGSAVCGMAEGM
jgi:hypothetical protein